LYANSYRVRTARELNSEGKQYTHLGQMMMMKISHSYFVYNSSEYMGIITSTLSGTLFIIWFVRPLLAYCASLG
jgi:hypothetical protein